MPSTLLNVVFGGTSLLLIALAIPLIQRRVRPNRLYGFRTPATLNDERLWYEVNAKTGVDLLVVGIGQLGLILGHVIGWLAMPALVIVSVVWVTGGALWSTVHGFAIIRRTRT